MKHPKHWWSQIPVSIRKPIVLIVGTIFIFAAAAIGWLPGPGGIPLFLIGIAILATEFVWAEKLRDYILEIIKKIGLWYRANKVIGTIVFACGTLFAVFIAYMSYKKFTK